MDTSISLRGHLPDNLPLKVFYRFAGSVDPVVSLINLAGIFLIRILTVIHPQQLFSLIAHDLAY
jgi:hypothetical protein